MIDHFEMGFAGASSPFTLTISANSIAPNIPSLASAAGWDGQQKLEVNITAALINQLALLSGWSFPSGLEITISAGTLVGGVSNDASGGGFAMLVQIPVAIRNLGTIAGAGGAGGTGQHTTVYYSNSNVVGLGASGGRGRGFASSSSLVLVGPLSGGAGQYVEWSGPVFGGNTRPWAQGGAGGAGGGWGASGATGSYGSIGGSYAAGSGEVSPPTAGFGAGPAVNGNAFVSWLATGTRLGPVL